MLTKIYSVIEFFLAFVTKAYNSRLNTLPEPKDAKGYFERGNDFLNKGEILKAINDLDEAVHLNPQFGRAYYNRGLAKNKLGQYKKAVEDFDKAIGTNPLPPPIKIQNFTIIEGLPKTSLENTRKQLRILTKQ